MEKLYKNKEWLYQKYIIEKLSTVKIAKICESCHATISNWLIKYNIKIRTNSESQSGELGNQFGKFGKLSPAYRPMKERFWEKVDKNRPNGCWIWIGSYCKKSGYGKIYDRGHHRGVHVVSWELHNGRKVRNGYIIHHSCMNPRCCNPEHLQEVTIAEHKKLHKSKKTKGEKNGRSKLTKEIVLDSRTKYTTREYTIKELAEEHDVAYSTMHKAIIKKSWKHI